MSAWSSVSVDEGGTRWEGSNISAAMLRKGACCYANLNVMTRRPRLTRCPCTAAVAFVTLEIWSEFASPATLYLSTGNTCYFLRYAEWLLSCPVSVLLTRAAPCDNKIA